MTLTAVINPVVPLNLLFPHQRVICPHSRQSAKYRIVPHNFTNDGFTDGNSPSYQNKEVKGWTSSRKQQEYPPERRKTKEETLLERTKRKLKNQP